MHADFQVESRSYDQLVRGKWRGYRLPTTLRLGDESDIRVAGDGLRLWLPAGTPMHWSTATRPLRNHCLQFFWPERWYTLSAFYADRALIHTYASIIQPARIELDRLTFVDLDLNLLVKPDLSYEVLTQVEFEQAADLLNYSEEVRIGALLAVQTLVNALQLGTGLFALIPRVLDRIDFQTELCSKM